MLIRLADRKDSLKGDLNILQERALVWLMQEEFELQAEIERERLKYTLLAGNPELYSRLYEEDDSEELDDSEVEWLVPESAEEVHEIIDFLQSTQVEREKGI
jgi:hypothetical protein